MRVTLPILVVPALMMVGGVAAAQTPGAPASPSGAPAEAAQDGSSMAGAKAAKNEMKAHNKNEKKQKMMANPHK